MDTAVRDQLLEIGKASSSCEVLTKSAVRALPTIPFHIFPCASGFIVFSFLGAKGKFLTISAK